VTGVWETLLGTVIGGCIASATAWAVIRSERLQARRNRVLDAAETASEAGMRLFHRVDPQLRAQANEASLRLVVRAHAANLRFYASVIECAMEELDAALGRAAADGSEESRLEVRGKAITYVSCVERLQMHPQDFKRNRILKGRRSAVPKDPRVYYAGIDAVGRAALK
jgi:hypothetical protein